MKLIVFDIDGTLLDSVRVDDDCFKDVFKTLYNIDLSTADWSKFKHVTDTGLTVEIFDKWLHRIPTQDEINLIKHEFYKLLNHKIHEISTVYGALEFIDYISSHTDFKIAFATGGWEETAKLKCSTFGLQLEQYILKSSNDHFDRTKIMQLAIDEALLRTKTDGFDKIVYFGDGLWDYKSTLKLGIDFIGVDYHGSGKLKKAGCETILKDFSDFEFILNLLK
ncbi:HAD family hydrolase [Hyunsoonleella ulvae]|uniref:HAD family hydrolase n=1 Tax=Hyunsoonleella ulvae TaxID=2799948 RepID=UPI0019398752|nr:HAD hydrolase-like protein [Hyunsoonleella ulvae]